MSNENSFKVGQRVVATGVVKDVTPLWVDVQFEDDQEEIVVFDRKSTNLRPADAPAKVDARVVEALKMGATWFDNDYSSSDLEAASKLALALVEAAEPNDSAKLASTEHARDSYVRAIGEIEAALGCAVAQPLDLTVNAVKKLTAERDALKAECGAAWDKCREREANEERLKAEVVALKDGIAMAKDDVAVLERERDEALQALGQSAADLLNARAALRDVAERQRDADVSFIEGHREGTDDLAHDLHHEALVPLVADAPSEPAKPCHETQEECDAASEAERRMLLGEPPKEEPKPARPFRVGDVVRLLPSADSGAAAGLCGTIAYFENGGSVRGAEVRGASVQGLRGYGACFVPLTDLELVTPAPTKTAKCEYEGFGCRAETPMDAPCAGCATPAEPTFTLSEIEAACRAQFIYFDEMRRELLAARAAGGGK